MVLEKLEAGGKLLVGESDNGRWMCGEKGGKGGDGGMGGKCVVGREKIVK